MVCGDCRDEQYVFDRGKWKYGDSLIASCCGTAYVAGRKLKFGRIYHIVCRPLEADRKPGMWAVEKVNGVETLFVTCPRCDHINATEADEDEIDKNGFVGGKERNTCIECTCGFHFWPFLEGWERSKGSGSPKEA